MEAYIEPIYSSDKDAEIFFREAAISYKRAESALLTDMSVFTESDEDGEKKGAFQVIIDGVKKMINSIINTIQNFISAIKNSFGEKLTVDMYMKSGTAQARLNCDIEAISKQIEDEILAERKGVQAIANAVSKISSATNVPLDSFFDAKAISKVVDKVEAFAANEGVVVLKAAAVTVIANKLHKSIMETTKLSKKLQESNEELERKRQKLRDDKVQYFEDNGRKVCAFMTKMTGAISKTSTRAMNYYSKLTGNINDFNKNLNKFKK